MARKPRARRTPTSSRSAPPDPTTQFAIDVAAGRIVAGEHVRAACARHLEDLKTAESRGLVWDAQGAARAIGFFPAVLSITAGAKQGLPFNLLPWQVFCAGNLFGWRKQSGRLRFRNAWLETGKGQAKSPFMAAIGIYLTGYFGIHRSEVYAIAWDKDQANVLFKDAVAMCRAPIPGGDESDTLEARGEVVIRGTLDNAWKIEHPDTGSKFQSLANGLNISGPRPTAVLADEIHEFKNSDPIETWKRAIAKMPGDAMMILGTNTPSSSQIAGTEYSEFYQKVATGDYHDDEAFSFIARVDKDDDPFNDETCWPKSLPALGITFPVENIRGEVNTARQMLSTALSVKRLYFGIPVGSIDFWIAEDAWQAVQDDSLHAAQFAGCKCWLALDLSRKNDLTALSAAFEDDDGVLHAITWYWTRRPGLRERSIADKAPYEKWVEAGHLDAVDKDVIDKTFVAAKVRDLCELAEVEGMAIDIAGIDDFVDACDDIGFKVWKYAGPDKPAGDGLMMMPHAQGTRVRFEDKQLCMPRSIERLEDRILTKQIRIAASPVTYSCAANAMVVADGQNNRAFDKKRSRGRIDGLVTLAMAVGAMDRNKNIGAVAMDIAAMIG